MTPSAIIRQATADGIRLALTPTGTIEASGDGEAVSRWLPAIRDNKPSIVKALQEAANTATVAQVATVAVAKTPALMANYEALIRSWLAHIEETDPEIITEVLAKCRDNLEARAYFLHRAEEAPSPVAFDRQVTCGACRHFQRIEHPHLGQCAQGELEAASGLWDTDRRLCKSYAQRKALH